MKEAWADDAAEHRIHGVNEYQVFSILAGDLYDVMLCVVWVIFSLFLEKYFG